MNPDANHPLDTEPPRATLHHPHLSATTLQAAQAVNRYHIDRIAKATAARVPEGLPRGDAVAEAVDAPSVLRRTDPAGTADYNRPPVPFGFDSTKETP